MLFSFKPSLSKTKHYTSLTRRKETIMTQLQIGQYSFNPFIFIVQRQPARM